ncbi:Asp-tRNA(Asn)/Glu-tRNA(Gln) amidotransferase subunit GatC [Asticcacaulis sp. DW145]|uniref:Aspartyl/glutamyl-tRNA(Asn/Gln) amidotransferase subunit C n=1 Tax=Asticcacaulis currens TaxID=2984210 RepID=A0ABT5IG67_9CAUL|nr:Asp-tRNA(Asn)/Glu-tRNA(Gln) amidotransferase subunit GatC [Asticcacaulis currens]MDC7695179.1 Asp-tRNA(Asn)/Glu-tRNA(Gln) amidotransferase subunit GatC [Asticcacaulis currens]BEV12695.1 Asp-tRNA(Asn)/Glu-tRNA(Gln) amidotransferase subunit GatC [Asticcacaulis sp. DW145]
MAIDVATVRKVASLSRLRESDERLESLAGQLNGILGWIEQLNEVDVSGVQPMTSCVEMTQPLRDDVVTDGGKVADVVSNAPKSLDGFFIVPKVVE